MYRAILVSYHLNKHSHIKNSLPSFVQGQDYTAQLFEMIFQGATTFNLSPFRVNLGAFKNLTPRSTFAASLKGQSRDEFIRQQRLRGVAPVSMSLHIFV